MEETGLRESSLCETYNTENQLPTFLKNPTPDLQVYKHLTIKALKVYP